MSACWQRSARARTRWQARPSWNKPPDLTEEARRRFCRRTTACRHDGRRGALHRLAEQAETAADHHIAEGCGEGGTERRVRGKLAELAALRAGDSDALRCTRMDEGPVRVVGAVALALEHLVVGQLAGDEAKAEVHDLLPGKLAGVVLEETGDAAPVQIEAEQVHVAEVQDEPLGMQARAFIVEGTDGGCRARIHE